ncbi:MAG TPA: hypothetical protein VN655_11155 [Pseudolabrys sp.]|jgi:hypothetical protein|nr:hypothetical protein [Pseudolabrys sp.]
MSRVRSMAALGGAVLILGMAAAGPARAEFFGCNDRPGKVLYDSGWHSGGSRYTRYSHDYSAQPHRTAHARVTYSSASRYYGSHYR